MPVSPLNSPKARGFLPLGTSRSNTMENDIPLAPVRSNASSTGARKANQGLTTSLDGLQSNEKQGSLRGRIGRRKAKQNEPLHRRGTAGSDEIALNAMGRLYNKIIGFSVVSRYLVYIVPVAILLAVPLVVLPLTGHDNDPLGSVATGTDANNNTTYTEGPPMIKLFIWIELMWVVLWAGKVVAHLIPAVFMFLCGVVSSGTRKYATVLRALEIPLSLFFWALATWVIFKNLIGGQYDVLGWVTTLKRILGALFVSSAVFLGEKAIVQLISVTYHQRSFANRIKDSKREVFLLGLLYDASRTLFPMYCPEFAEEDYIINDSIEMMLGGKKGRRGGAATPMRLIGNVGRFGDKVTSVFGNLASEITGKQVFNPNSAHSIVVEALEKARTSEALAKRIWMSFVVEGNDSLYVEDIIEVLGPAHQEDAEECFAAIDADSNGDISLDEMIRKVVEVSKERKAIANSMKDISQALAVFDKVLLFIVLLIVIFIFLAFFQSSFISTLATAGTALLSLSFAFSVTTQEFLGSCIFLFVKHPYDVGDRVDITGSEKEQLVVERISLLYTVFNRIDKMQIVQVPNIVLNNLWIENVTRSKAMKEVIDVNVSYDTTFEDIELLRQEMENFVRHTDNSRDFMPDLAISVAGVGDLDKLQLKIAIKHKSNWHNDAVRGTRRSKFMCALTLALKRVPIYPPGGGGETAGGPTNPTYSVSITDAEAARARAKAAEEKEKKRMLVTQPQRTPSNATQGGQTLRAEMAAAQHLNSMNPVTLAGVDDWGYNRDDNTLNSRDPSMERVRSNEVERLRQDLHKTESQRSGRRKPGEALPSSYFNDGSTPGIQITQHNSLAAFDEEAQIGGVNPYPAGLYDPAQSQPVAGGRAYPPPRSASNPVSAQASNTMQSSSSGDARTRGASVSKP
ncbi:Mechanosensitive ion channel-domain-containing protein [Xylariales sp. PMI_506]|nr:Mechanosensitive ion channel-domain-containing protein [Xylariales sp. PMI_506]